MRFLGPWFGCGVVIAACGGTTANIDGGVDGSTDGNPNDSSGGDVITLDASECVPPHTTCASPCPQGTICLRASGPTEIDLGCTTIPPECNGTASCACMADCFCPPGGLNKCIDSQTALECSNGAVSRREFKKDIDYVRDDERAALASEALSISLARYRYKTEPAGDRKHLGFIIDDVLEQSPESPAVASDATHVDLYGYTSMLLATVQEQQKQIDALNRQVAELRRESR
jgi:hypothetical protein